MITAVFLCLHAMTSPLFAEPFDHDALGASEGTESGQQTEGSSSSESGGADSDTTAASDAGGVPPTCGWTVLTGTHGGYFCGENGEDPQGLVPRECPGNLQEGLPCGTVSVQGCCDDQSDAWRCLPSAATGELVLTREACGEEPPAGSAGTDVSSGDSGSTGDSSAADDGLAGCRFAESRAASPAASLALLLLSAAGRGRRRARVHASIDQAGD
jgi:hypothetical protein